MASYNQEFGRPLTKGMLDICSMMAAGGCVKEIASQRKTSVNAVYDIVQTAQMRMGFNSRKELIEWVKSWNRGMEKQDFFLGYLCAIQNSIDALRQMYERTMQPRVIHKSGPKPKRP